MNIQRIKEIYSKYAGYESRVSTGNALLQLFEALIEEPEGVTWCCICGTDTTKRAYYCDRCDKTLSSYELETPDTVPNKEQSIDPLEQAINVVADIQNNIPCTYSRILKTIKSLIKTIAYRDKHDTAKCNCKVEDEAHSNKALEKIDPLIEARELRDGVTTIKNTMCAKFDYEDLTKKCLWSIGCYEQAIACRDKQIENGKERVSEFKEKYESQNTLNLDALKKITELLARAEKAEQVISDLYNYLNNETCRDGISITEIMNKIKELQEVTI